MVINIRGTSGSGKSTIARLVMSLYTTQEQHFVQGRQRPVAYECSRPDGRSLWVVGHYEVPCGGADTLSGNDYIYQLVRSGAEAGCDVLYEGVIVGMETSRCLALAKEYQTVVIHLSTPLDTCLASIRDRRMAKGNNKPVNPANTASKHRALLNQHKVFQAAGVDLRYLSREETLIVCRDLLSL